MNLLTLRGSYLLTPAFLLTIKAFDVPGAPINSEIGLKVRQEQNQAQMIYLFAF